jgi:hypothetical protein
MDALIKGTGENLLLGPDLNLEKNMNALINRRLENLLLDPDPH